MKNNPDFSKYFICDADIWVYISQINQDTLFLSYFKFVAFADVVEQEILKFDKPIDTQFLYHKKIPNFIVIYPDNHLSEDDKLIHEAMLIEFGFSHGHSVVEKHKGEYVSAILADHFNMKFLCSNDGIFRPGNIANKQFPTLKVKDWNSISREFLTDKQRIQATTTIETKQKTMKKNTPTQSQPRGINSFPDLSAFLDKIKNG